MSHLQFSAVGIGRAGSYRRPSPVSAVHCDRSEELLWFGTTDGRLGAHLPHAMHTRVQVPAHQSPIVAIHSLDDWLLSASRAHLRCHTRDGVAGTTFRIPTNTTSIDCCAVNSYTAILGASGTGTDPSVIALDLTTDSVSRRVRAECGLPCVSVDPRSSLLCFGRADGGVELRDSRSYRLESRLSAHTGAVTHCAQNGTVLLTCGRIDSERHDPMVKVFDIRTMRPLTPLMPRLTGGPIFTAFFPCLADAVCVVSSGGQWQTGDVSLAMMDGVRHSANTVPGARIVCADLSATGHCLVLGDTAGLVHEFATHTSTVDESGNDIVQFANYNDYSRPSEYVPTLTELATTFDYPSTPFALDGVESLATLPFDKDLDNRLLSSWHGIQCSVSLFPIPPLDPRLIDGVKWHDHIGHVKLPIGSSLTEQQRKYAGKGMHTARTNSLFTTPSPADWELLQSLAHYRRVSVPQSKFGFHTLDFSQWNHTPFTALDALLPNSYCNPLLHSLYFIDPVRRFMLSHLCARENCLHCELGFLFHMLDSARGSIAEPRNFLRALKQIPEAAGLNLLDDMDYHSHSRRGTSDTQATVLHRVWPSEAKVRALDSLSGASSGSASVVPLIERIQACFRFILEQLRKEATMDKHQRAETGAGRGSKKQSANESLSNSVNSSAVLLEAVFSHRVEQAIVCPSGRHPPALKAHSVMYEKLNYSNTVYTQSSPLPETVKAPLPISFTQLLAESLNHSATSRVWCDQCNTYQLIASKRRLQSLPEYLNIECNVQDEHASAVFKQAYDKDSAVEGESEDGGNWLPQYLFITLDSEGARVTRAASSRLRATTGGSVYELTGVVSLIADPPSSRGVRPGHVGEHLVLHCKVSPSYGRSDVNDAAKQWFVFNDFFIENSDANDATRFDYRWKQPCILVYQRVSSQLAAVSAVGINPFTRIPFPYHKSLSLRSDHQPRRFTPLQPSERIDASLRVAIDCEFVSVQPEITDFDQVTGDTRVIRASRMQLARVSVVRETGVPLMDDYILANEPVVDYLTRFSGLVAGDLDRSTSPHHLTTLKQSYIRLRHLIDHGVTFIGHGLESDFRVCNLVIPPSQVLDTVKLYSLPNQRKLALKFLAVHVLNIGIQTHSHDSIEDARTALALVHHYETVQREGGSEAVDAMIQQLYQIGRTHGFKIE